MPDENMLSILTEVNQTLHHLHDDFKSSMKHLIETLPKLLIEASKNVAMAQPNGSNDWGPSEQVATNDQIFSDLVVFDPKIGF